MILIREPADKLSPRHTRKDPYSRKTRKPCRFWGLFGNIWDHFLSHPHNLQEWDDITKKQEGLRAYTICPLVDDWPNPIGKSPINENWVNFSIMNSMINNESQ